MATGLHDWFAPGGEFAELSGQAKELLDEVYACGAVLTGRRTAELNWITGVVMYMAVSRSSCPVTARSAQPLVGASVGHVCDRWDRERDGSGEGQTSLKRSDGR
jgi:hypothetical protein